LLNLAEAFKGLSLDIFDKILGLFAGEESEKQGDNIDRNIARIIQLTEVLNGWADALQRLRNFINNNPQPISTNLGDVDVISGAASAAQRRRATANQESKFQAGPLKTAESALRRAMSSITFDIGAFNKDFFSFDNFIRNSNIPNLTATLFPPPSPKGQLTTNQTTIEKMEFNITETESAEATANAMEEKFDEKVQEVIGDQNKKAQSALSNETGI